MNAQKIEFDGITLEIPIVDTIKIDTDGIIKPRPVHAIVIFHYPYLKQVTIAKFSESVYEYCKDHINTNEYHLKTFFIL